MNFSESELSKWHGADTCPDKDGVYQIRTRYGTVRWAYWSKRVKRWYEPTDDMFTAVYSDYFNNFTYPWRGLAKPFAKIMEDRLPGLDDE